MDIVYFNTVSRWGQELKFSLRSIEKYYTELDNIWIVGYLPDYIDKTKVIHIPDILNDNNVYVESYARYQFCLRDDCPENFIIWCDDQYLLQQISTESIIPYNIHIMADLKNNNITPWQRMLYKSYDILKNHFKLQLVYNFESHTPFIINQDTFLKIFSTIDIGKNGNKLYEGVCTTIIYFNLNLPTNIIQHNTMRIGYYNSANKDKTTIYNELKNKYYLSHNDPGLT